MHYLTPDECRQWVTGVGARLDGGDIPERAPDGLTHVRFLLPQTPGQLAWLCQYVSRSLEPRHEALLWVTQTEVFPSSENWHLYYRLRQSYADVRQLHEAPGHLFLDYEAADLASFLQIGLLSGWDMFVIPQLAYGGPGTAQAFVSHDEWIRLSHRDPSTIQEWRQELERGEYRIIEDGAA